MNDRFAVSIINQDWLHGCEPDHDLCTHGKIRLMIGGVDIANNEMDYGISETALALLRSTQSDHTPDCNVAGRLVMHGCGTILMIGCPIGIDWTVEHEGGHVRIRDVVRCDDVDTTTAVRFGALNAHVPLVHYRREILAFATEAREFFIGAPKTFCDDFDKRQFEEFWSEYDLLLSSMSRHGSQ